MTDSINEDARKKVWELIKDIRVALLVTHDGETLHARPMAAMSDKFDGILWFFTRADSPKIAEIRTNANVLLSYSNPSKQEYVSVRGTAQVSEDRIKIHELWSEAARIWFPQGKDDPAIRIIRVEVAQAEYWDSSSSAFVMVYGYAKAKLTGEAPKMAGKKKVSFS